MKFQSFIINNRISLKYKNEKSFEIYGQKDQVRYQTMINETLEFHSDL